MPRRIFVTTALPYANGSFHIGHIMEYIQADIWVRFQRMQGHEVHFVCADDAHGAPIMLKAEAEGIAPQELVARIGAERPKYLKGFHIAFDNWYSTDSPENVELSQDIYRKLKAAGLVYAKPVEQFDTPELHEIVADMFETRQLPLVSQPSLVPLSLADDDSTLVLPHLRRRGFPAFVLSPSPVTLLAPAGGAPTEDDGRALQATHS
jgi:methionyl-tRNA synthetase